MQQLEHSGALSVFNRIADQPGFHLGMPAWKLPPASKTLMALMKEDAASIPLYPGIDQALRAFTQVVGGALHKPVAAAAAGNDWEEF